MTDVLLVEVFTEVLAMMSLTPLSLVIFSNLFRSEGEVKSSADVVSKKCSWRSWIARSLTSIMLMVDEVKVSFQVMVLAGTEPYIM